MSPYEELLRLWSERDEKYAHGKRYGHRTITMQMVEAVRAQRLWEAEHLVDEGQRRVAMEMARAWRP